LPHGGGVADARAGRTLSRATVRSS
jgi:hypothetical protein